MLRVATFFYIRPIDYVAVNSIFFWLFCTIFVANNERTKSTDEQKKNMMFTKVAKKTVVVVVLFTSFSVSRESNQMESN